MPTSRRDKTMDNENEKIKRILRAKRAERGYTQSSLAKAMNCTQTCISNWETGGLGGAAFADVIKLCKLLRIDVAELAKDI
jgi:DNA-binding XRE family transcriptional regulator